MWNDERLYFEARRVVIAEIQHIVFNEWLPLITGDRSLSPLTTNEYFTGYDHTVSQNKFIYTS